MASSDLRDGVTNNYFGAAGNMFATGDKSPVVIAEAYTNAATGDVVGFHNTYQVAEPYRDVRGRVRSDVLQERWYAE